MKKSLYFLSLAVVFTAFSCSNEFDVAAPWKDIPVVYGLLNLKDPVHYIRVEKAFLDPKANALELARIADSLYYPNATVRLKRMSNGQVFTLQKVDGNLVGKPREPGVFADAPNWLYKIDSAAIRLKAGEAFQLLIDRGNGLPEVSAEAVVLSDVRLRAPAVPGGSLRFDDYNRETRVSWDIPAGAKVFDAKLVVNYAEYEINNPASLQRKSIEWEWERGLRPGENATNVTSERRGIEFYQLIKNNIPVIPGYKRIFEGIDIVIIAGGESLEKYVNASLANTGITSSQELPTYSNLSEGKGVFSSINQLVVKNVSLTTNSVDSLRLGYLTKDLNF